jgi:hypothetical protein
MGPRPGERPGVRRVQGRRPQDENREEIESALAYLDALTAIEISAVANAGGCYSPELLDRWGAMGEDNHRQRC